MSVPDNIFAYTAPGVDWPGYVSINRLPNGDVSVSVRGAPDGPHKGIRVCKHKRDAGPFDCYPGGPHCNNYCNMAPEKGPMQDHAEEVEYTREGPLAEFTIPADEWTLK